MKTNGHDSTVTLDLDGTQQRVRICGRTGLPLLLVVQGGPGLPLLNEIGKFQQRLNLEQNFSVAYWDQRGCGAAASKDAERVSLQTQVDDLCAVIRWLSEKTQQQMLLFGISIGGTIALQAAVREASKLKAAVVVSVDTDTSAADQAALTFLQEGSRNGNHKKISQTLEKLGPPPYLDLKPFQSRGRLMGDLGGIEYGRRFGELFLGLLSSLVSTYGPFGTVRTLRNMNTIQRRSLAELAKLNLFANWPRPEIPVHYIFGDRDPLNSSAMVQRVSGVITEKDTIVTLPNAGHMVHFDQPAAVRSVILQAWNAGILPA
ncbi:MAG: hypothetical protein C5B54_03630 [Acidobacteria bacterium]|nr:MAG: hypothetical protein C5B54_03630 [Acidobacteriota bacterium]